MCSLEQKAVGFLVLFIINGTAMVEEKREKGKEILTLTQAKDAHMLEEMYMSFRKHMRCFSEHMKIIQFPLRGISQTEKYYIPRFLLRQLASWYVLEKW